ncbi:hypothetical protein LMG27952_00335 [Paraburkholderia hiiakae]|uniref:Uncharacterized protein n=1 Tax=Paraburkholderia hiiakae TaxID=1081782 RepID=A0ABM8N9K3_9BURK|nr:hypothetical protein LMG27952_00335 [Paraburkholderia hiiakae]
MTVSEERASGPENEQWRDAAAQAADRHLEKSVFLFQFCTVRAAWLNAPRGVVRSQHLDLTGLPDAHLMFRVNSHG